MSNSAIWHVRCVVAFADHRLEVWDPLVGEHLLSLVGHDEQPVHSVATFTTPNGSPRIVSGAEGTLCIWDGIAGGAALATLKGHNGPVRSLATFTSPTGQPRLVSGGFDFDVCVWDPTANCPLTQFKGHLGSVTGLAVFPARDGVGCHAISASTDRTLRVWPAESGGGWRCELHTLTGHTSPVWGVACFVADGCARAVSASSDSSLRVWDPLAGTLLAVLTGHTNSVLAVACLPATEGAEGIRLVSASDDRAANGDATGSVRLWKLGGVGPSRALLHVTASAPPPAEHQHRGGLSTLKL